MTASVDDESAMKSSIKMITDRNKVIKESNKKRKKAGLSEIVELASSPESLQKVDGKLVIVNKSLQYVDFSWNDIDIANYHNFSEAVFSNEEGSNKVKFLLKNVLTEDQVTAFQSNIVEIII
jgi:hypothetical protein